ncbi:MAG: hypothetical protein LRY41_01745 [Candidatus Pacebacteria bacterium]|nr:hypothetical protein [Candidatus Paceibacterota bacterium]MCD8563885.1 hypothetical protein [Candidatus Paceibacterota bacterium]
MAQSSSAKPTQDFIPIREVRDGIVVLEDGGLRGVLLASSINIALKSAEEQQAVISQFQNFLNALDFSIQISVQSRRLDIRPYILLLEERYKEQKEELLRVQTREYIEFIQWLNDSVNIMDKSFFIVVPYAGAPLSTSKQVGFLDQIGGMLGKSSQQKAQEKKERQERFEEDRTQLEQRLSVIKQGLSSMGIKTVELGTQEIVEMYYNMFNPGETQRSVPGQ